MSSAAVSPSMARRIVDRAHDRALPDHRIALEIHLGDQPLRKAVAEHRKMDMRRAPVVGAVRPRIGSRLDGAEGVRAVLAGDGAAAAAEIRVERRQIAFLLVPVAAAGIGLPDLQQRTGNADAALVEHAAVDDDARPDRRFARRREIVDQVVVELAEHAMAEHRSGDLRQRVVERQQRPPRRAQHRRLVAGREGRRVPVAVARKEGAGLRLAVGREARLLMACCSWLAGLRRPSRRKSSWRS